MKHTPVLLKEAIEYLAVKRGGRYIDATYGSGGHSREIAERGGEVLGIDLDPRLRGDDRVKVVHDNFADIRVIAQQNGFTEVDGILFDLGLSSEQLDDPERGFSFQKEGPLDMRMDKPINGQATGPGSPPIYRLENAANMVNTFSEKQLVEIFYKYGEERRFGKRVARGIVDVRKLGSITATTRLFDIIKRALPSNLRFRAGDTARRIFQALRIAVNRELENLEKALPQAVALLRKPINGQATEPGSPPIYRHGGRLVVISFHSLEDRIVKQFFADDARGCICPPEFPECRCGHEARLKVLTKKPVVASAEETELNPRAKSAKLRAAERIL